MAKQASGIIAQGLKALTLLTFFYPIRWAVQCLPWRWALKLGALLGHLHARFIPDQLTRHVRAGLKSVWPNEASRAELEGIVRLNLATRYKHLIDGFFYQSLDEQLIERMVPVIDNKAYLDDALDGGKGAILLMSHFGSFGMLIGGLALRGYRLRQIFTLTPQPPYRTWHWVERAIMQAKLRCWTHESVDFEFWRPGRYLRPLYRELMQGKILVLYGDGVRGRQFVSADFMSYRLLLSAGPFRLAARAEVALIPAFILRQVDDCHRIVLEKPIVLEADDSASILQAANQYAALLAYYVRTYPDHWFTWARLRRGQEDDRAVLELMNGKVDADDFYSAEKPQTV